MTSIEDKCGFIPLNENFHEHRNLYYSHIEDIEKTVEGFHDDDEKNKYLKIIYALEKGDVSFIQQYVSKTKNYYIDHERVRPINGDIVILGGVSTDNEVLDFYQKVGETGKIIGFEPATKPFKDASSVEKPNISIIKKALGSEKKAFMYFNDSTSDNASINARNGKSEAVVTTIDLFLSGQKCNLIKLNLNGYELEALRGAKSTIKNYKPKLMIKVDPWNIVEIPKLIQSISKDYEMWITPFDSFLETIILYAQPKI